MTRASRIAGMAVLAVSLGGCFDSLVSDPCATGFSFARGACVAQAPDAGAGGTPDGPMIADAGPDAMPDAWVDAMPDAWVDAMTCTAPLLDCGGTCVDVTGDPDNCGACGRICPSGVCSASVCSGALLGHIVAIGHDYRSHHPTMARVLGDSVALGAHSDIGVARWHGTAAPAAQAGTTTAITAAMTSIGRSWHAVTLGPDPSSAPFAGIDVLVIDAQLGDGAAAHADGVAWRSAIGSFLTGGGVVIVLEGSGGVSYQLADGASLYTIGAPIDATGVLAFVVDGTDITTQQVVSPYLAETTSVTLPGAPPPAIATAMGGAVVFHVTR